MSRPKNLPRQILYNPNTRLGAAEPFVLMSKDSSKHFGYLYWHICDWELNRLEGGQGLLIGRQECGPFHVLQVYRYRVVSHYVPWHDKELQRVKDIKEYLNDYV